MDYVADDDEHHYFVMKVVSKQKKVGKGWTKPMFHFWRSKDSEEDKEKTFLPVYRDAQEREDWRMGIGKDDPDFSAWVIEDWPREALDEPFELTEDRRIPLRVWDIVDDKDIPIRLIGGPQPKRWVRAKKRRRS